MDIKIKVDQIFKKDLPDKKIQQTKIPLEVINVVIKPDLLNDKPLEKPKTNSQSGPEKITGLKRLNKNV